MWAAFLLPDRDGLRDRPSASAGREVLRLHPEREIHLRRQREVPGAARHIAPRAVRLRRATFPAEAAVDTVRPLLGAVAAAAMPAAGTIEAANDQEILSKSMF